MPRPEMFIPLPEGAYQKKVIFKSNNTLPKQSPVESFASHNFADTTAMSDDEFNTTENFEGFGEHEVPDLELDVETGDLANSISEQTAGGMQPMDTATIHDDSSPTAW